MARGSREAWCSTEGRQGPVHEGFGAIPGPPSHDQSGGGREKKQHYRPGDAEPTYAGSGVAPDRGLRVDPARTGRAAQSQRDRGLGGRRIHASIAGHADHGHGIYGDDQPGLVLRNNSGRLDRIARFQQRDLGARKRSADPNLARAVVHGGLFTVRVDDQAGNGDSPPDVGGQGRYLQSGGRGSAQHGT